MDAWNINVSAGVISLAVSFSRWAGILSGPVALCGFKASQEFQDTIVVGYNRESGSFCPKSCSPHESFRPYSRLPWVASPSFINSALKNEIWKIPLQIFVFRMLLRLVHEYFIFVFLIINMLS